MIHPGEKCPTCERKVPHPRKPASPDSVVKSFRIPKDAKADFEETLDAATQHVDLAGRPFSDYWVLTLGLVALLQAPPLEFRE